MAREIWVIEAKWDTQDWHPRQHDYSKRVLEARIADWEEMRTAGTAEAKYRVVRYIPETV